MSIDCNANIGNNISFTNCDVDLKYIAFWIVYKSSQEKTVAEVLEYDNWIADRNKSKTERAWFLNPGIEKIKNITASGGEPNVEETETGYPYETENSRTLINYEWRGVDLQMLENLDNFSGVKLYGFGVTRDGEIIGARGTVNAGKIKTIPLYLYAGELNPGSAGSASMKPFQISLVNRSGNFVLMADPTKDGTAKSVASDWSPFDIEGLVDVTITATIYTTSSVVLQILGKYDYREITGLLQADFDFSSTFDGEIASVIDNSDGTYTIAPTASFSIGATTATLLTSESMTLQGIGDSNTASFTIA